MKRILFVLMMAVLTMLVAACNGESATELTGGAEHGVLVGTWYMNYDGEEYRISMKEDGTGLFSKHSYESYKHADITLDRTDDGMLVTRSKTQIADGWTVTPSVDSVFVVIESGKYFYALKRVQDEEQ